MTSDQRIVRMRELTRRAHAAQTRNGGRIPYWVHTDGVAQFCQAALLRGQELPPEQIEDVVLAAYGHDLYEDTDVTPELIRAEFGDRVAELISGMTNEQSDQERAEYQRKLAASAEEVRLIKCADLADNMFSVAYGLHDVGLEWATGFFLPIADETRSLLAGTPFARFPVSGGYLMELVESAWARFEGALVSAEGQAWAKGGDMGNDQGAGALTPYPDTDTDA